MKLDGKLGLVLGWLMGAFCIIVFFGLMWHEGLQYNHPLAGLIAILVAIIIFLWLRDTYRDWKFKKKKDEMK